MKKFLVAIFFLIVLQACKVESPKISIFTDHITTIAQQEKISFSEAATLVRNMGYAGADINCRIRPEQLRVLDSLGFGHSCAIAEINYCRGEHPEQEAQAIDFLKNNKFDVLLLVPGTYGKNNNPETAIDSVITRVAAFTKRVEELGVKVVLEDYDNFRSPCLNSEGLQKFFDNVPSLGHAYDSGNYVYCGEDPVVAMNNFMSRIAHVHLKDRVSAENLACPPVGEGCVPMETIITSILDSGYNGWLTVEQYGSKSMLKDSETSITNVKKILGIK